MVSFQCHGCGDVIRKPKLDQHHGRCHAGFDCIDCSVTFNTPAEFKSHTSCITEAEKYQKSLYNGPKSGGEGHGNARGGRGGFQGRGRGGARGGQARNRGTGANGMPLGAPQRMSPVITPVDNAPSTSAKSALPASASEKTIKEKKSKDKKSKSKSKESTGKVEANQLKEHAPVPSIEKAASAAEKKKGKGDGSEEKKKTRKSKGDHSTGDDFSTDVNAQAEVDKCEEALARDDSGSMAKKSKRIPKGGSTAGVDALAERKEVLTGDPSKEKAGEQKAVGGKKKKSKDKNSVADAAKVDLETQEGGKESKEGQKKEKKRKSPKVSDKLPVPPAEPVNAPSQKENSGKKSTKRKREGGGANDGDTAAASGGRKKTKNGPKDDADATAAAVEVKDTTSQGPSGGRKRRRGEKDGKTVNDVSIPEGKEKKRRKRMEATE